MNYTMPGMSDRGQSNALTGLVRMDDGQGNGHSDGQPWGGWNRRGMGDDRRRGLYGGMGMDRGGGMGVGLGYGAQANWAQPQPPLNALTATAPGEPVAQPQAPDRQTMQAQAQQPAQYQMPQAKMPIYTATAPTAPPPPVNSEVVGGTYGAPEPEQPPIDKFNYGSWARR